ncbi:hypothetical protein K443DRAFT_91610, partial [Laccaria amethystina LaAM-08-1]
SAFAGEGKPAEKYLKLRDRNEFIPPTRLGKFGASHIELRRRIRVGVKRVRKTLDDNFGRKDGGADVEMEGVNVKHAYERGWVDVKLKWRQPCFKISVRLVPMSVRHNIPLLLWLLFVRHDFVKFGGIFAAFLVNGY